MDEIFKCYSLNINYFEYLFMYSKRIPRWQLPELQFFAVQKELSRIFDSSSSSPKLSRHISPFSADFPNVRLHHLRVIFGVPAL